MRRLPDSHPRVRDAVRAVAQPVHGRVHDGDFHDSCGRGAVRDATEYQHNARPRRVDAAGVVGAEKVGVDGAPIARIVGLPLAILGGVRRARAAAVETKDALLQRDAIPGAALGSVDVVALQELAALLLHLCGRGAAPRGEEQKQEEGSHGGRVPTVGLGRQGRKCSVEVC